MDDEGNCLLVGIFGGFVNKVDNFAVLGLLNSLHLFGHIVDKAFRHEIGSQYHEVGAAVELVRHLLLCFGQTVHVFAFEGYTFFKYISVNHHIFLHHARYTFAVAFGHKTVFLDAARHKVIDHGLGTTLR